MKSGIRLLSAVLFALMVAGSAYAQGTLKIAFIDPLTGPPGLAGQLSYKHFLLFAEEINAKGGVLGQKVEIVHFENRANPQESQIQAQKAIDAGIHFLASGISSAAGVAISDFVNRNNERNPDKRALFFNYGGSDPVLSNEKCSYWQTNWDANTEMKTRALAAFIKTQPNIKKVYLINQDYGMGRSVQAEALPALKEKRPDIKIVGDEFVPLMKVNDFTPYVAKIRESGADTVFTSNWGPDLALLIKAAGESGLKVSWITMFAAGPGGPLALKQANVAPHTVYAIADGDAGVKYAPYRDLERRYRAKFGSGLTIIWPRAFNAMTQLVAAINETKSTDPKVLAEKINGRKFQSVVGGDAWIRAENNAVIQPLHISSFGPLGPGQEFDEADTGWGWRTEATIPANDTIVPTTCKMVRPG
jgi:branched-chain amino acid transport system substrate-binding protein